MCASLAILFHLAVVVIAPWSNPPPSSPLAQRMASAVVPYMKVLCLDNGYRFFAPDPGPSHLVRYELWKREEVIAEGRFPDRTVQRPRLLYHRFFMISEMIASQVPARLSATEQAMLTDNERRMYELEAEHARLLPRGVAGRLLQEHPDADSVRLYLQKHLIPSPQDVLQGVALTDRRFYQEIELGEFRRESMAR